MKTQALKRKNPLYAGKEELLFDIVNYTLMFAVLAIILYPLLYIVGASFSEPSKVASGEMWLLPKGFTLEGYARLFKYGEIWMGYSNTVFYTFAGTIINLAVTLPCAYALSRKDFVGRTFLSILFMITMFFSGGLVPAYLIIKQLNLLDTRTILLIGGATAAYNLFIARSFFATTIPYELQEAGRLDGCSNWKLFTRIVLPLSTPIIAVLAMFFGVGHWNSYFGAMIYLKDRSLYPLQLILREILIQSKVAAEMAMTDADLVESLAAKARISELIKYTSIIVSTVPMLALYIFFQRYFVQGVMLGAVKS